MTRLQNMAAFAGIVAALALVSLLVPGGRDARLLGQDYLRPPGAAGTGTAANRPVASPNNLGQLYFPSDAWLFWRSNGAAWTGFLMEHQLTAPPLAGTWTQVNFGTSTFVDSNGAIVFQPEKGTNTFRIAQLAEPARPYTITARFAVIMDSDHASDFGIGWRENGTGKLSLLYVIGNNTGAGGAVVWQYWSAPNTYGGTTWLDQRSAQFAGRRIELQIRSDNTNLSIWLSSDGSNWVQAAANVLRSTAFTVAPDRVVFVGNVSSVGATTGNAVDMCTLYSWEVN